MHLSEYVTATRSPITQASRREQGLLLMQFCAGVDLEDCIAALARSGDNIERAASLLFDPDAVATLRSERVSGRWQLGDGSSRSCARMMCATCMCLVCLNCVHVYPRAHTLLSQEAKLAAASGSKSGDGKLTASTSMQTESARLRMAKELSAMLQMSVKFCAHALLMFGDDANRATDWLLSDGGRWASSVPDDEFSSKASDSAAEPASDAPDKLDDLSALEDLGECVAPVGVSGHTSHGM
jgi:hypothetical protein